MEIKDWLKQNFLKSSVNDGLIEIDGKKFLEIKHKNGKIFDDKLLFILSPEESGIIALKQPNCLTFLFGERYYYANIDYKIFEEKDSTPVQFNDLKWLGSANTEYDIPFSHLGVHSEYELLNGTHDSEDWCKKAKFLGQKVLAICDKNTLSGTLSHQVACNKYDIKSIIGETITIRLGDDLFCEGKLYVVNEEGWRNLLRINKEINVVNFADKFIDEKTLLLYSAGLIFVLSKGNFLTVKSDMKDQIIRLKQYLACFTHVFYQLDFVEYSSDESDLKNLNNMKEYLKKYREVVEPVLICDTYYIDKEESQLKRYINQVGSEKQIQSNDEYYKTVDEIIDQARKLFTDEDKFSELFSQAIGNANFIADTCNFKISTGQAKLPKFELISKFECCDKDGNYSEVVRKVKTIQMRKKYRLLDENVRDNEELFFNLLEDGWDKKLSGLNIEQEAVYRERLERELGVIVKGGLIDYLLINWDILRWCRENGIYVGTGRGSVCGSLVAFLIDLTSIDPLKYDLLFERFLNETRTIPEQYDEIEFEDGTKKVYKKGETPLTFGDNKVKKQKIVSILRADQMADIDNDVSSLHRDDVKRYIEYKYGLDYTCSAGSYNKLKLKGAIKDFARVEGLKFSYVNYVTSEIDDQLDYTWRDLFKYAVASQDLKNFVQKYPELVNSVKSCLGQSKSASVHASAVLIAPKQDFDGNPMTIFDWMPMKIVDGVLVSEWEGKFIDKAGFLKVDILALSQLDKFKNIIDLVQQNRGEKIVLEEIPLDDKATYKVFQRGLSEDVFQFTTYGMKNYLTKVKPDNIEDLIAMTALWRPGAMQSNAHMDFAMIKHGKKKVTIDRGMERVVEKTQGLYIYQESVMLAMVEAGMSLIDADLARSCIKKFDKVGMAAFEKKFIAGMIKNKNYDEEGAQAVWNKLMAFSNYGFNKSHSAAYSITSYWCQYLKVHYPLEFWTTSLQFAKSESTISNILYEMRKVSKIKVASPDINRSVAEFYGDVKTNTIYWNLISIKGLGDKLCEKIVEERRNGMFKSLEEFINRTAGKGVGKDKVKNLIICGAFDEIEGVEKIVDRMNILKKYSKLLNDAKIMEGYVGVGLTNKEHFWILKQKELTGFGVIDYKSIIMLKDSRYAKEFVDGDDFLKAGNGDRVVISGQVASIIKRKSKKGEFCKYVLQSNDSRITGILWNDKWKKYKDILEAALIDKNKMVAIYGKVKVDQKYGTDLMSFDNTKVIEL